MLPGLIHWHLEQVAIGKAAQPSTFLAYSTYYQYYMYGLALYPKAVSSWLEAEHDPVDHKVAPRLLAFLRKAGPHPTGRPTPAFGSWPG